MHRDVELIPGDIRDSNSVEHALADVDAVIHLASLVGVGQSMYEIGEYTSVNNLGTATLLQILSKKPVKSVVVASSMSIYGDGAYSDSDGNPCLPAERTLEQLRIGDWELRDARGRQLAPVATPENTLLLSHRFTPCRNSIRSE